MLLADAYWRDEENKRTVLKFKPSLAPYKVAVFPLLKKTKPALVEKAQGIFENLTDHFTTVWDERGNIGKRYYYQDEIGTPFCVHGLTLTRSMTITVNCPRSRHNRTGARSG